MQDVVAIAIVITCSECRAVGCLDGEVLKPDIAVTIQIDSYYPCQIRTEAFHIESAPVYSSSPGLAGLSPVIGRIETTFDSSIAGDVSNGVVYRIGTDSHFDD